MNDKPVFRDDLAEKNQLQCSKHLQTINKVKIYSGIYNLEFLCPECNQSSSVKARDPTITVNKEHRFYTITLPDLSAPIFTRGQENEDEVMEFRNMEMEHIISDEKSTGYSTRNLVFIPDKNLLVACSRNGHITIWSIGEFIQWRSELQLDKPFLAFAKYINRGDCGNNYLILGLGHKLNVYEIINDGLSFVKSIDCKLGALDVEWISQSDKLAVSENGNNIYIWDLKSFTLERTIDVHAHGTQGPIHRMIYLNHKNALVLENINCVSLISLEEESSKTEGLPKHFQISDRKVLGLAYLPISRCFILRGNSKIEALDEDSFTVRETNFSHPAESSSLTGQLIDSQILINEDESQCIINGAHRNMYIYFQDGSFQVFHVGALSSENLGLEVIKDQHRVVLGDEQSGKIYILRTNAEVKSDLKIPGTIYPPEARKRGRQPAKKKTQPEKSKDQLKERAAKKEADEPKPKNVKGNKGSNDGAMEIEKPKTKGDKDEIVSKRETRSKTRKEPEETEEKAEKPKVKGKGKGKAKEVRGNSQEEKQEEKTRERSKSRKGKKK